MKSKYPTPPPRKGPNFEAELESLYRRRLLVENLIRTMEAYVRAGPDPVVFTRKVA